MSRAPAVVASGADDGNDGPCRAVVCVPVLIEEMRMRGIAAKAVANRASIVGRLISALGTFDGFGG